MKFSSSVILATLVATVSAAPMTSRAVPVYNIHPNGDNTKCIGILGGQYVEGAAIDIYDCNGSASQKWFWGSGPRSTNPADGSVWAMDLPAGSSPTGSVTMANGVPVVIRPSADGGEDGSPTQGWNGIGTQAVPAIKSAVSTTNDWCLDLTNGSKVNRTPLQIWECVAGNANQKWTYTTV